MPTKSTKKVNAGKSARKPGPRRGPTPTIPLDPLQRYTLPEAAALLRISHMSLYKYIRDKKIKVIVEGKRKLVPGQEIVERSSIEAAAQSKSA